MFRELRVNYCQFFCIDEDYLLKQINAKRRKSIKNKLYLKNKISLKESNKVYSIFQNIAIEKTFKLRDKRLFENHLYPSLYISDKIDKKKIILKIPELMTIIDEIGLDYNWYTRLDNFRENLIKNSNMKNFINSDSSNISPSNIFVHEDSKESLALEKNNLEKNIKNSPEQFFDVIYSIKKLGNFSYYIIYLSEKIDINNTSIENKEGEVNNTKNLSKDNTSNSKDNKINSSYNIFKNFLSARLKQKEKNNQGNGENNAIIKASKTKNFFSKFILRKATYKENSGGIIPKISQKNDEKSLQNSKPDLDHNINENNNIGNDDNIKNIPKSRNPKIPKKGNNNTKRTNKTEDYEDDENSPLIKKDKFKEKLKKIKKENNILIMIICFIIIISLFLVIIKLGISEKGFTQTKSVLKATIYLEMLKIDIYVQAILSIIYCINEKESFTEVYDIQSEAKRKIKNTLDHLKILQDQINLILNNKNSEGILNILEEKYEIFNLNDDWTSLKEEVELMGELRSLSYKLYELATTNETCSIEVFYEYEKLGAEIYINGKTNKSNDIQKIIYYFLRNIFRAYKTSFDKLSEESANTIEKMWINYQNTICCILICIMILMILFIIIYIIKFNFDYSYYRLLFLYYYNIENEQLKFENQIYYLYKAILEFNDINIYFFEFAKNNADSIDFPENKEKNYLNRIKNKNQVKKENNQKENIINTNTRNEKTKSNEKNSTAGTLLNGSINVSSFHFLNNSNNKKLQTKKIKQINNSFVPNSIEKEEENTISQEETIETFLNFSKKILPNSLKISLIFIILTTFIYLSLSCANIIDLLSENKVFKYSINLSMNILERIPQLMGILIYTCFTIITGNDNLIKPAQINYNQSKYLTFFKADKLYYSEDIMNKYLTNKYFGKLLKDTLRINYNFDNYLYQETNDIFTNTKEWEKLLNKKDYFCVNAAIGEVISFQNNYSVYEFAKEINNYATNCKGDDTGINESGAQLEINYILQEITNKYIEFITYNNSDISYEQVRFNFFGSKDIKRIILDMQLSLILYYNTITYTVTLDFEKKNNIIINEQILYSGFIFFINIIIIIGLLFSVTINEKYKKLFGYFSEIPNIYNK